MQCAFPFRKDGQEFACQRCTPCRVNRRRLWTARILLEQMAYPEWHCWFVTLTYKPECLPPGGTLVPSHLKQFVTWFKNNNQKVRYYGVGEYGEQNLRPHYHVILFGLSDAVVAVRRGVAYFESPSVSKAWQYGFYHMGAVTQASAGYTASYTLKKMTKKDDKRLAGKHPEFARMSLKPGIGVPGIGKIIDFTSSATGSAELVRENAVVSQIRMGGKIFPLGKYLRRKIAEGAGYDPRAVAGVSTSHLAKLESDSLSLTPGKKLSRQEAAGLRARDIATFIQSRKLL